MDKIESLESLLLHELKDIYGAEKQLLKKMPKMAKKASSPELKQAFETHADETEEQVQRLERVFDLLGERPKAVKCKGMGGILEEAEELLKQKASPETLDAGIIMAAQKVEHYEIAAYGSAATWAEMLGRSDVKRLLGQTLEEEESTDEKLTMLAQAGINQSSAQRRKAA